MAVQKGAWRSMVTGCFKPPQEKEKLPSPKPRKEVAKQNSFQRVSISDLSNPSSLSQDLSASLAGSNLHVFTLQELKVITQNFSANNFIGEGGFGPVHKGFIDDKLRPGLKAQPVAVKLLDLEGAQGHREWLTEVIFLGQLRHPHLVKLIGYCCEEDHRLLVYEYMPRGSLENQLFRRFSLSLPWSTRMKIAFEAAKGLAFLHESEKPVIYRDFKASNILLDSDYSAKLSDFGLAKDGPQGSDTHVSTRVMGTHGYAAPEYIMTGHLTAMSDVYSFGVVLLELLTGRRAVDKSRPQREHSLVDWARPMLNEPRKLGRIMDARLEGQYSESGARKAAALGYLCLSQRPKQRPTMSAVVNALKPLKDYVDIPIGTFVYTVPAETEREKELGDCNRRSEPKMDAKKERSHNHHQRHHQEPRVHKHHHQSRSPIRSPSNHAETASGGNPRHGSRSPLHNRAKGAESRLVDV